MVLAGHQIVFIDLLHAHGSQRTTGKDGPAHVIAVAIDVPQVGVVVILLFHWLPDKSIEFEHAIIGPVELEMLPQQAVKRITCWDLMRRQRDEGLGLGDVQFLDYGPQLVGQHLKFHNSLLVGVVTQGIGVDARFMLKQALERTVQRSADLGLDFLLVSVFHRSSSTGINDPTGWRTNPSWMGSIDRILGELYPAWRIWSLRTLKASRSVGFLMTQMQVWVSRPR